MAMAAISRMRARLGDGDAAGFGVGARLLKAGIDHDHIGRAATVVLRDFGYGATKQVERDELLAGYVEQGGGPGMVVPRLGELKRDIGQRCLLVERERFDPDLAATDLRRGAPAIEHQLTDFGFGQNRDASRRCCTCTGPTEIGGQAELRPHRRARGANVGPPPASQVVRGNDTRVLFGNEAQGIREGFRMRRRSGKHQQ